MWWNEQELYNKQLNTFKNSYWTGNKQKGTLKLSITSDKKKFFIKSIDVTSTDATVYVHYNEELLQYLEKLTLFEESTYKKYNNIFTYSDTISSMTFYTCDITQLFWDEDIKFIFSFDYSEHNIDEIKLAREIRKKKILEILDE